MTNADKFLNSLDLSTFTKQRMPGLVIFRDNVTAYEFRTAIDSLPDGYYIKFTHILDDGDVGREAMTVDEFTSAITFASEWVTDEDDDFIARFVRHQSIAVKAA